MNAGNIQLIAATQAHLLEMMTWFPTQGSCAVWGGPGFRFPFTAETFEKDSKWRELASFALVDESADLCGFGQFYLRANRCHLGRLVTEPTRRGQGLGTRLIHLLTAEGTRQLQLSECSLFVSVDNPAALALYERLAFRETPYPETGQSVPRARYMIAPVEAVDAACRAAT